MKCPNCGEEMQEDALYCEKCGSDIHIVPDFEPEMENNLMSYLQGIAEDVKEGIRFRDKNGSNSNMESSNVKNSDSMYDRARSGSGHRKPRRKKGYLLLALLSTCVLVLLAVVVFACVNLYQYFSSDYQIQRASACMSQNRYDAAVGYYKRAMELESEDIELVFSLAEAYMQMGNKIEYEYLLRDIIRNPLCTQEQLEKAYGKLIVIYRDREEYDVINEILQNCNNEAIRNAYQIYLASPPQFNYESGTYDKMIPVKLTSATVGRIYYTTDGSEPNSESLLYTSPILLEKGKTVIKAVVINDYGVASEVVSREYQIKVDIEDSPDVSVISGTYHVPMLIEVEADTEGDIYYTTDGTAPSLHSTLYTGPIPMPLGKSTFRFAVVKEDGTSGKVAKRSYELKLDAEVSVEDAEALVVEYMLIQKKIYNEEGYFSVNSGARYLYEYQSVVSIEDQGDYYVIAEIFRDEKGVQNKTGTYYGVNIHEKKCYKLETKENNNYSLVEILIDSPNEG